MIATQELVVPRSIPITSPFLVEKDLRRLFLKMVLSIDFRELINIIITLIKTFNFNVKFVINK